MTIEQINKRCEEIQAELSKDEITEEEISKLEEEVRSLTEERKTLVEKAEKRAEVLTKVVKEKNVKEINPMEERREEKKMEERNIYASAEYRTAYFKKLMGRELNEEEKRAMSTASAKGVPTSTADKIVAAIREVSPVVEDIDLYFGSGYLKVFVKGTNGTASETEENENLNSVDFVLNEVELTPKRITEFMRISGALNDMSIDDFEAKMIEDISGGLAKKIENKIFTVMKTVETNVAGEVTEANLFTLYGALKSGYAKNAKFYMNRATKASVMAVSNKSKNDLYLNDRILGTPIEETDELANGVIIYGNAKFIVGELGKNITIENDRVLSNDSYEWLGVTMFDCGMGIADAFKKLAPTE